MWTLKTLNLLLSLSLAVGLSAAEPDIPVQASSAQPPESVPYRLDIPPQVRAWYRNPDGSCVQCSIGMCGITQNVPAAYTLLWDTQYGSRVRGGSWPSRVEGYCEDRDIKAFNVTGAGLHHRTSVGRRIGAG